METRLLSRVLTLGIVLSLALAVLGLGGCQPDLIGRYNQMVFGDTKRVQNEILHSYDQWYSELHYWVQGEPGESEDFPGPLPDDLKPPTGEYLLGPNDLLQIIIQDLFAQGQGYSQQARISENGTITLPYLQTVKAADFTTHGLEQRISDMLKANGLLNEPHVSILVTEYRNRFYSILSGVHQPGMFPLIRTDMNLLEALSVSGGTDPMAEKKAYIMRRISQEEFDGLLVRGWNETGEEGKKEEGKNEEPGSPKAETPTAKPAASPAPAPPAAPVPSTGLTPMEELQRLAEGKPLPAQPAGAGQGTVTPSSSESPTPKAPEPAAKPPVAEPPEAATAVGGWKFEDGRWVQVKPAAVEPALAAVTAAAVKPGEKPTKPGEKSGDKLTDLPPALKELVRRYGIVQGGEGLKRVIRVDVPALLAMDPSQDVVLRNGDVVNIPQPPQGEWYIDGEVNHRGPYSLTGRKITLLQAVCAAGGLTQLAVPRRTELVRRIDDRQEEIIYVDLGRIAKGQAPDFFLQPDDLIRVGTDQGAIFLAVLRNAFRATYGFGTVYDTNFADMYPFHGGVSPLFGGPHSSSTGSGF